MSQTDTKKAVPLLLPICLYLIPILLGGIALALSQSLGGFTFSREGLTVEYYRRALTNPTFLSSLGFSLRTTILSSVLSVSMGTALALSLRYAPKKSPIAEKTLRVPVIVPHIVVVLMMTSLFAQTGILARLLHPVFPEIGQVFSRMLISKSGFGIIITYLWKEIPFVAMMVYASLVHLDSDLIHTAKNLGATTRQTVRHVILPIVSPAILASFLIVFAYAFGAYEVPWLIGPTVPKALPVQAFLEYTNPLAENRPLAMAYAVLLLVANGGLLAFALGAWRTVQRRKSR